MDINNTDRATLDLNLDTAADADRMARLAEVPVAASFNRNADARLDPKHHDAEMIKNDTHI